LEIIIRHSRDPSLCSSSFRCGLKTILYFLRDASVLIVEEILHDIVLHNINVNIGSIVCMHGHIEQSGTSPSSLLKKAQKSFMLYSNRLFGRHLQYD